MTFAGPLAMARAFLLSESCQMMVHTAIFGFFYAYTLFSMATIYLAFNPRAVNMIHRKIDSREARITLCVAMSIATEIPHYLACIQFTMMLCTQLGAQFNFSPRNHYTITSVVGILFCCYPYLKNLKTAQVLMRSVRYSESPTSCGIHSLMMKSLTATYTIAAPRELHVIRDISFYSSGHLEAINVAAKTTRYEGLLDIYKCRLSNHKLEPVVIYAHGGGWTSSSKEQPSPLIRILVERGFLVVSVNYRLAPRYPQPAGYEDLKLALAWTQKNIITYGGDPHFIVLAGDSAGAHLVQMTAMTAESRNAVQGTILLSPSLTVRNEFGHDESRKTFFQNYICGGNAEAAEKLGLIQYLTSVRALPPVLAIHGESDNLVSHESLVQFRSRMEENGHAMDLITLKNTHHAFMIFNSPKNIAVSMLAAQWALRLFREHTT